MPVTVNIKMYRVGELGDCFLLRFNSEKGNTHVLIDCGSFRNSEQSINRLKQVANDIKKQLNGAPLDIIVGTHQHNDHLSGFVHAEDIFKEMNPGQVWLSWLDNPADKKARAIGNEYNNYLTRLRHINKHLQSLNTKNGLSSLLGFWGIDGKTDRLGADGKFPAALPQKAVEILRNMGSKKPLYLSPGDLFNLPGLDDKKVKVYVLGPPKNEKLLFDKDPNKNETYDPHLAMNATQAEKLLAALNTLQNNDNKDESTTYPFDEPFADSEDFDAVWNSYYSPKEAWRQIDLDWLNQAESLGLWLDDFTNNSSLVLAFELEESKKVLLFAADAQTGNWNSWREIKWKKKPAGFNWLSLMNNTVLYKTGHHGSHNSTLVEGLNNMTHEELVAMIPVDKTDPNITKKNGWKMPAHNLYEELKLRTQSRVIRMDDGVSQSDAWKKLPFKAVTKPLYIEYEVKDQS